MRIQLGGRNLQCTGKLRSNLPRIVLLMLSKTIEYLEGGFQVNTLLPNLLLEGTGLRSMLGDDYQNFGA